MPAMRCNNAAVVAVLFALSALCSAETAQRSSDIYLIVDYLPAAAYEGDAIHLNVRAENATANPIKGEWVLTEAARSGENPAPRKVPLECAAKSFAPANFSLTTQTTAFSLELSVNGTSVASLKADLLHDNELWPKTTVRHGVLEKSDAPGERIVLVTPRRDKKVDRAFLPLKWVVGKPEAKDGEKKEISRVAVFAAEGFSGAGGTVLGPYALDGLPPIIHATRQILDSLKGEKACIVVLPPEDIEAATDPRVFRIILEVLLVRLKAAGVESVAVLPPFRFAANATLLKNYWKEANEVCAAHQAKCVDPAEFCAEEFWRISHGQTGVYGVRPNEKGRARIDGVIKTLQPIQK